MIYSFCDGVLCLGDVPQTPTPARKATADGEIVLCTCFEKKDLVCSKWYDSKGIFPFEKCFLASTGLKARQDTRVVWIECEAYKPGASNGSRPVRAAHRIQGVVLVFWHLTLSLLALSAQWVVLQGTSKADGQALPPNPLVNSTQHLFAQRTWGFVFNTQLWRVDPSNTFGR